MPDGSNQKDDDEHTQKEPRRDNRSESGLIEGVEDYYEAVDREDWTYTYQHLDSRTQAMFTEEEWHFKNQWYADTENLELATMDVGVNDPVSDTVVGVTVKRTFKNGTPLDRDTMFVYEDDTWLHRFTKEENKAFMPDASNEEFVAAHR